jgi:hypothetical protein
VSEEPSQTRAALGRAGRRAGYHMLQAMVETLKALEAVIEELGDIGSENGETDGQPKQRIVIE